MLKETLVKLSGLTIAKTTRDDDKIDQLHHFVSVTVLVTVAVFVGANQWSGDPIHCWIPKQYDEKHYQAYVDHYCWITNLYNIPMDQEIPIRTDDRQAKSIGFYRWVTVMFFVQALMFKLPHLFWKTLRGSSGINIEKIVKMTLDTQFLDTKEKVDKLGNVAAFVDRWLKTYTRFTSSRWHPLSLNIGIVLFFLNRRSGSYLVRLSLVTKIMYFINVIAQFPLLTSFLDFDFYSYGADVTLVLADEGAWKEDEKFPRIALCDFEIRQLQNVNTYTVQCVLSIMLFLEKIYAIMWFCLIILAVLTAFSLAFCTYEQCLSSIKERFLRKYIRIFNLVVGKDSDRELFKRFVRRYLRDDGVFLLQVVSRSTSKIMALDLTEHLWNRYKKENHKSDDEHISPTLTVANDL